MKRRPPRRSPTSRTTTTTRSRSTRRISTTTTTTTTTRRKRTTSPEPASQTGPDDGAVRFALGLGSNLARAGASPAAVLAATVRTLDRELGPLAVAPLYRTRPIGPGDEPSTLPQPAYFNTAVAGITARAPEELLALGQRLEREAGRRRDPGAPRDAPRPLDVDLLVYGQRTSEDPALTLPHPRLRRRRFVLAPLADVAPDLPIPPDGATPVELLAAVGQQDLVERVEWPGGLSEPPSPRE